MKDPFEDETVEVNGKEIKGFPAIFVTIYIFLGVLWPFMFIAGFWMGVEAVK